MQDSIRTRFFLSPVTVYLSPYNFPGKLKGHPPLWMAAFSNSRFLRRPSCISMSRKNTRNNRCRKTKAERQFTNQPYVTGSTVDCEVNVRHGSEVEQLGRAAIHRSNLTNPDSYLQTHIGPRYRKSKHTPGVPTL
jgi:hypothetical protein